MVASDHFKVPPNGPSAATEAAARTSWIQSLTLWIGETVWEKRNFAAAWRALAMESQLSTGE
jgi:hypothetical protein